MSIVTPVDVAVAVGESDPASPTYSFTGVKNCKGTIVADVPVTFKAEWAAYWTEDHRVCSPEPPKSFCVKCMSCLRFPSVLMGYIIDGLAWVIYMIIYLPFMVLGAAMTSCRFKRAAPVVTHESFYYWLKRNGFTSKELKKVKEATKGMTIYVLAHKLTDVRDVEELIKLQSIEKQKLVVVILQQSTAAIDAAHAAEYQVLKVMCARLLFNWGAQDVYKLGDAIAKNGRLCTRGEGARKKADWEQCVASRVNLRVNAVLRCINTVVKEGRIPADLARTLDRADAPMNWANFVIYNKNHDKLLVEFHTAAPYLKQYMTNAILTESYCSRLSRVYWAWMVLLALVTLKLAKVVIVTDLAESPGDLLAVLESGNLPSGGFSGTSHDDGSVFNMLKDKSRDARLENREAQLQEFTTTSMKLEKLTELAEPVNPVVPPLKS
ncbi:hypothetical protein PC129_g81 [Phytophthora cactorum]|uniref:Uncharacterized protein n=1 Tax=Phytophthora cactorum TaxID=29920 RepID=A0A8T1EPK7_9STRA|nr:hypothetical protein PC112_g493 [Phytophthora cactorum]KAG2849093.1 hypothetical protein PC111_g144 [Phytophthora cactorum]KAG2934654.1 hypothetical protein PC114_g864 [Phytophthora cactorum]KAG2955756.1 hypothetical protein PC117_g132 [Phytophthora cactorum]KAG3000514.1 hypothetical protein PC118_g164 [Phytophthora cactorum]